MNHQKLWDRVTKISLFSAEEIAAFLNSVLKKGTVRTDARANVHVQSKMPAKVQIFFRLMPRGFMTGGAEGEPPAFLGTDQPEEFLNAYFYEDGREVGVVRKNKEGICPEPFKDTKLNPGIVYSLSRDAFCKEDELYGTDAASYAMVYLAVTLAQAAEENDKPIRLCLWNSSLSGEGGILEAFRASDANYGILTAPVLAGDAAESGKGICRVAKDGCFVEPAGMRKTMDQILGGSDFCAAPFVGKTDRSMEYLSIAKNAQGTAGFYLPVEHQNTRMQKINLADVEKTRNCLLKIISEL